MVIYNFPKYEVELEIDENVYFPSEDTFLLLDNIKLNSNEKTIIEIGGGSGLISIVLAKKNPKTKFIVTDLSFRAVKSIQRNKKINKVDHQIEIMCTDKINGIKIFSPDIIIWNPPYLPFDKETENISNDEKMMLIGGIKGFEEVYELINQLIKQKRKTKLITIFSSIAWKPEDLMCFNPDSVRAEIIEETKFFFEKLYLIKFEFDDKNG